MTSTAEKVRQLAPHWGVMFVAMFVTLAAVERVIDGEIGFLASMVLVLIVAFAYPYVVRALGVAPSVWRKP